MKTLSFPHLLLFAICSSGSARAQTVTFGAAHDTAIVQANANNSNGGGPAFFAGIDGNSSPHRALLSFDLAGLPQGATITNVQLTLTLAQVATGGPSTATIGLFDLTRSWGEGSTATANITGASGSGQGAPAAAGDATWNAAFYSATTPTLWSTAGGDHVAAASASFTATNSLNSSFIVASTLQLVADVQGWLANPATNFGWELINANEMPGTRSIYGFYSREWPNYVNGNANQVPALQVTYSVPEPRTGALALSAGLAICCLPRRPIRTVTRRRAK